MTGREPLLEVTDLRKSYGDKVVLHDIDLTVHQHDVICLIGSSGSGKSTLLRALNLLEQIDDGVIRFDGREISDPRIDPREVRSRTGGRGANIVFEHVGAAIWQQALKCLGKNGRLVTCGATTGNKVEVDLRFFFTLSVNDVLDF